MTAVPTFSRRPCCSIFPASVVDLTFEKSGFASVPLVLTFVNEPAAVGYECQNRDTSGSSASHAARIFAMKRSSSLRGRVLSLENVPSCKGKGALNAAFVIFVFGPHT